MPKHDEAPAAVTLSAEQFEELLRATRPDYERLARAIMSVKDPPTYAMTKEQEFTNKWAGGSAVEATQYSLSYDAKASLYDVEFQRPFLHGLSIQTSVKPWAKTEVITHADPTDWETSELRALCRERLVKLLADDTFRARGKPSALAEVEDRIEGLGMATHRPGLKQIYWDRLRKPILNLLIGRPLREMIDAGTLKLAEGSAPVVFPEADPPPAAT